MKLDVDKVIFQAALHKNMASLAREFNMNVSMFRYNLGKARKLDLVKSILRLNKQNKLKI